MTLHITDAFDGGNIRVLDASDPGHVRLEIKKDYQSDFYQWFYFRVTGEAGTELSLNIENAGGAAFTKGWENYNAVVSYDQNDWLRVPSSYDGKTLTITTKMRRNTLWVAYFAPYTEERHQALIAGAQGSNTAQVNVLGETIDGRPLDLITIGDPTSDKPVIWVTGRQHPGESMAEWWMEGFLERLLDITDQMSLKLLEQATLYIVPNMNPDGSARGHLRTNAVGTNLNREWATPSLEKSPEVYFVLYKMRETGCKIALDVHGDEAIPYNFIAGAEGITRWNDDMAADLAAFQHAYVQSTGGVFQTKYGYPLTPPGKANLSICTNALAQEFGCLAMTLEMPFKDDNNHPNKDRGWSPMASKQLGANAIEPLLKAL
ncbi:MAG: M14-type cytosolic carboxypeptidase [Pseudomonadota bacterium]